jgi:hypothetical protein
MLKNIPADSFIITRAQLEEVFKAVRRAYDSQGYHTLQYWRNGPEGLAAAADTLLDILEAQNPELYRELYFSIDTGN